jgi:hypothetical protein
VISAHGGEGSRTNAVAARGACRETVDGGACFASQDPPGGVS